MTTPTCLIVPAVDNYCGFKVGPRESKRCTTMVAKVFWQAAEDQRKLSNVDLPKVDKFFADLEGCSTAKSNKYCSKGTSIYVWEFIAFRTQTLFTDWHIMNGPARFSLGFGADGIVFATWKTAALETPSDLYLSRCRETFNPPSNAGWNQVIPWENQYVIEEYTLGANAGLRPVSYGTNSWQLPVNRDGRGIFCFFDKLYFESFYFATISADNKDRGTHIALYTMECLFQPVKVERWDYFEMLLKRMSCTPVCPKQNVHFWPCVDETTCISSKLENIKDDDIVTLVKPYDTGIGGVKIKEFKLTGKEYKERKKTINDDPAYDQYIEVKVVGGGKPIECIDLANQLELCKKTLATCQSDLITAQQNIATLTKQNSNLVSAVNLLKDQNTTLRAQLKASQDGLVECNKNVQNLAETNVCTFHTKWLKYVIPKYCDSIENSSENFDKSFAIILRQYVEKLDLTGNTNEKLLNVSESGLGIFHMWLRLPPERKEPISLFILLIALMDYHTRWDNVKANLFFLNGSSKNSGTIFTKSVLENVPVTFLIDQTLENFLIQVKDTPPGKGNEQENSENEFRKNLFSRLLLRTLKFLFILMRI
ncbi:hypothetical protein [Circular genetic element sp.]|nr:hypothetical protein [Circular genetic element sp.]